MVTSDMRCYYENTIQPIFEEIFQAIDKVDDGLEKKFARIVLFSFCRNTMAAIELINKANCTDAFAMTLRLLMEISADAEFVSNNPSNIKDLANSITSLMVSVNGAATFADVAKKANSIYLKNANGEKSRTQDRINESYRGGRFKNLYMYYCCYTHFNIAATLWTAKRQHIGDKSVILHSMYMFSFYPDIFKKLVVSLGNITGSQELIQYDCIKMKDAVNQLIALNITN